MEHKTLDFKQGFRVALENPRAQAAVMVIAAGDKEGDASNRHADFDQWLYVVSGQGTAIVEDKPQELKPGSLLLIERGERHEIRNDGEEELQTLNFYSPPGF